MIHLDCPRCASVLEIPDRRADSIIRCPECEERLRVPTTGQLPSAAPAAPGRPPAMRTGFGVALVIALAAAPVFGTLALLSDGRAGRPAAPAVRPAVPPAAAGVTAVAASPSAEGDLSEPTADNAR
jgi:hypothetical protein